jgi:hypothetical protein
MTGSRCREIVEVVALQACPVDLTSTEPLIALTILRFRDTR